MSSPLIEYIHRFSQCRVLLIGDLILDRYVYGDAERISPEAPVPVLRAVERRNAVGGAANVAACLKALGCSVLCAGVIGDDAEGKTLCALLGELDVDDCNLIIDPDRPTTTKTRLVGLAQHRHRQQLLRVDEEETKPLSNEIEQRLRSAVLAVIGKVDVVCIEDYDKGVISRLLVESVVETAAHHRRPVIADPARLTDYERYRGVDILTPNRAELSLALGSTPTTLEAIATGAKQVLEAANVRAMVVTLDREGALVVEKDKPEKHVPTVPRSVYDNTGAGDAVLAMLAAALAGGADLESATKLANIAGGLEVEKFGCVPIPAEEVLAELRLSDRMRSGKLRPIDELVAELNLRRDRGETVVFTNGCFDILHAGHIEFLTRCRQEASLLVIGLNSDDSVRSQSKGVDRPINTFTDRASVLGALACVDYVVGFDDPTPESLIRRVRPDVLAKGEDWSTKGIVGAAFVESTGGRVVLLPLVEGLSTTTLIERIRNGMGAR